MQSRPDTTVKIAPGLILANPVMTASGTFGYGTEYGEVFDVQRLGAIICKGTTLEPRGGNPPPRLGGGAAVSGIEVNISCPNVKAGGAAFGTDPASAAAVTAAVRAATTLPVLVKLTPNTNDITEIARAVAAAGAD